MKFINENEVVSGGVTIILFLVCVPKKRNLSIIVQKEGPAPSCSGIVALSFSTVCLRIS